MTRDDVFWLMQEVGASGASRLPNDYEGFVDVFERFANLVEEKEREACARSCEDAIGELDISGSNAAVAEELAKRIRMRSNI